MPIKKLLLSDFGTKINTREHESLQFKFDAFCYEPLLSTVLISYKN